MLDRDDLDELDQYESYLVSETVIADAGSYESAGNEGFRRLFRYISGGNASRAKIAMTASTTTAALRFIETSPY